MRLATRHAGAARVALLFAFFFLVIAAFWSLKPLRTSSVVKGFGADYYPLFKQGVVLVSPLMMMALTAASRLWSRERLVQVFTTVFLVSSWVFWALFVTGATAAARIGFFFFVDSYVTFMVALFWAYLNDIYTTAEARRHYSVIGLGGLCGGIVGSSIAGWASQALGSHIILVFTIFLAPLYAVVAALGRLTHSAPRSAASAAPQESMGHAMTDGVRQVLRSRYLLAVVVIVVVYEIISTAIDYQFSATVSLAFAHRDAMAAYQGKVFFVGQLAALVVQLFLTTFVHRRFGAIFGLLVLPLVLLLGSASFAAMPGLLVITMLIGGETAFAYSINQTSKEMLYLPLDQPSRMRAKAFIDIFGVRAAKATGAIFLLTYTLWLRHLGVPFRAVIGVNVLLVALWLAAIWVVAQRFRPERAAVAPAARVPLANRPATSSARSG